MAITTYIVGNIQSDSLESLAQSLVNELQKIEVAFTGEDVPELHAEPNPRYDRQIVFADGTNWNPGSGRGFYWYDSGASSWKFIG